MHNSPHSKHPKLMTMNMPYPRDIFAMSFCCYDLVNILIYDYYAFSGEVLKCDIHAASLSSELLPIFPMRHTGDLNKR